MNFKNLFHGVLRGKKLPYIHSVQHPFNEYLHWKWNVMVRDTCNFLVSNSWTDLFSLILCTHTHTHTYPYAQNNTEILTWIVRRSFFRSFPFIFQFPFLLCFLFLQCVCVCETCYTKNLVVYWSTRLYRIWRNGNSM